MNMLSALRRCLHSRYLVCFLDARKRRRPTEDGTGHKWNNYNTQSEFSGTWSVTNCTTVTQRLGYTFIRKLCENKFPNLPGQFSAPLWNENRMIFRTVGQGEANASNSHLIHLELVWKIIRRPCAWLCLVRRSLQHLASQSNPRRFPLDHGLCVLIAAPPQGRCSVNDAKTAVSNCGNLQKKQNKKKLASLR